MPSWKKSWKSVSDLFIYLFFKPVSNLIDYIFQILEEFDIRQTIFLACKSRVGNG